MSGPIDKISIALVKAQAEFEAAKKDSINPHFRSNYADLSSVIDAIKGAFAKNDLAYLQPVSWRSEGQENAYYAIETMVLHSSGQSISFGTMRVPIATSDLGNAQKVGAAITYARRYHLASALGISQEDDDGNSVSAPTQKYDSSARDEIKKLMAAVSATSAQLTQGQTAQQKAEFMFRVLGVQAFDQLARKTVQELRAIQQKLEGMKNGPSNTAKTGRDNPDRPDDSEVSVYQRISGKDVGGDERH
jgi:hypothetical protein